MSVDSRNGPKARAHIYLDTDLLRKVKMIAVALGISDSEAFEKAAHMLVESNWSRVEEMVSK